MKLHATATRSAGLFAAWHDRNLATLQKRQEFAADLREQGVRQQS
jgi:hypothetical protein